MGEERVISYFSKSFSKSERNYCVTRRELLAIMLAVKHFHPYLYGRKFKIRTDHGALTWLMRFKNPEEQLARWLEILSTYDLTIEYRAGRQHLNADALSRRPCLNTGCTLCSRNENRYDFTLESTSRSEGNSEKYISDTCTVTPTNHCSPSVNILPRTCTSVDCTLQEIKENLDLNVNSEESI